MGKRLLFIILFLVSFGQVQAQEDLKVEGYFLQDSAKLGEKVGYVLKATYGPGYNVVFPDSTYDFSPFVLLEKKSFISYTADNLTLDSAVYYVSNFSLDPIAKLSLPVYQIFKYDSLEHRPLEASLALKLTIDEIPQQPVFKENDTYQEIPTDFNYPLLLGALAILVVLALAASLIFGKQLRRQWQIFLEKRKYKRFLKRWEKAESTFSLQPSMENADELLGLWKTYMEHLKNRPFREWTATEIADFLKNKDILKDFREIEMIIYAGREGTALPQACANLKNICKDSFQQKITHTDAE